MKVKLPEHNKEASIPDIEMYLDLTEKSKEIIIICFNNNFIDHGTELTEFHSRKKNTH